MIVDAEHGDAARRGLAGASQALTGARNARLHDRAAGRTRDRQAAAHARRSFLHAGQSVMAAVGGQHPVDIESPAIVGHAQANQVGFLAAGPRECASRRHAARRWQSLPVRCAAVRLREQARRPRWGSPTCRSASAPRRRAGRFRRARPRGRSASSMGERRFRIAWRASRTYSSTSRLSARSWACCSEACGAHRRAIACTCSAMPARLCSIVS